MPFEVFQRTTIRVEEPTLSFTSDGRIVLNAAAARIFAEASIKSVLLLWDRGSNRCALKAAPKADVNAYAVSISPKSKGGTLAVKSFLSHIGWSARQRQTLPATWSPKERMLEVTLPEKYVGLETHRGKGSKTKVL
jgi:hypothetical protein